MSENFDSFLKRTSDDDREFLGNHELDKIPETICALENSSGGWIIAGAFYDETGELIISGLDDSIKPRTLFAGYESECGVFDSPARIIAANIKSLSCYDKPRILNNKVYRRVEGVNVISGKLARSIIALDSLESSRDDYAVDDSNIILDTKSINEFRDSITKYNFLSQHEFLRRSFIYSGKHLTFAGALMFGNILQVRAELHHCSKIFSCEAFNIWQACNDLITRLTYRLSSSCSQAVRAALVNALLHADYNIDRHINILIISNPPRIIINNPGMITGSIRNYRLYKIFELAEISHDMNIIKSYQPNFRLIQDFAEFRVIAEIRLEGSNSLPAPVIL
ncbi:MAG: hypothetical protein IJP48_10660 [Synergistaceae bacterium]|nr:hypothetical protein [Synergistaceae bacterium]